MPLQSPVLTKSRSRLLYDFADCNLVYTKISTFCFFSFSIALNLCSMESQQRLSLCRNFYLYNLSACQFQKNFISLFWNMSMICRHIYVYNNCNDFLGSSYLEYVTKYLAFISLYTIKLAYAYIHVCVRIHTYAYMFFFCYNDRWKNDHSSS